MKLIDTQRTDQEFPDNLSDFGTLIRFAGLVYENEEEGLGLGFEPYNMDGDVAFYDTREAADAAFDATVVKLKEAEDQFKESGDEEGMVALFETPKGLMIVAGTTIMGYETGLETTSHQKFFESMPHVTWERILSDMFDEEVE